MEVDLIPDPAGASGEAGELSVLVVNCGSGSVALDLVESDGTARVVLHRDQRLDGDDVRASVVGAARDLGALAAVAHRIVDGGDRNDPTAIDDEVLADIRVAAEQAPIHGPLGVLGIEVLTDARPDAQPVACFDTTFHAHLEPVARALPVPPWWRAQSRPRRGFHGHGHQWATQRAGQLLGRPVDDLGLVTVHLGGGASAAAVRDGHSIDVTMGSTPLEGMVMGTRSGSLDPAVVLAAAEATGDLAAVRDDVERRAGLLGLSGRSSDLRELYPAADAGDEDARLAIDVYVRSVRHGIAAMATALPRLDAVVLTGGAGSGSARLREDIVAGLGPLGARLDGTANERLGDGEGVIHAASSAVAVLSVVAREELVIAAAARGALARS